MARRMHAHAGKGVLIYKNRDRYEGEAQWGMQQVRPARSLIRPL
jgi:hypothetical protein